MLGKVALIELGVKGSLSLVLTPAGPQSCWDRWRNGVAHCLHFGVDSSLILVRGCFLGETSRIENLTESFHACWYDCLKIVVVE